MKMLFSFLFLLSAFPLLAAEKNAAEVVQEFYDGYFKVIEGAPKKFVLNSASLSKGFKAAYASLLKKTGDELDWDPILCGNDFPDTGYKVSQSVESDFSAAVTLIPRDASFKATIIVQVLKVDDRWVINGINNLVGEALPAGY